MSSDAHRLLALDAQSAGFDCDENTSLECWPPSLALVANQPSTAKSARATSSFVVDFLRGFGDFLFASDDSVHGSFDATCNGGGTWPAATGNFVSNPGSDSCCTTLNVAAICTVPKFDLHKTRSASFTFPSPFPSAP